MPFELMPLPFEQNALSPTISASTVSIHYGKHHRGYVEKLNSLVADTPLEALSLEGVVSATYSRPEMRDIFNVAAQVLNHDMYWKSLMPGGGLEMPAELARQIEQDFGSSAKFDARFLETASAQFGSGWVWLVTDGVALDVISTDNAVTPLVLGLHPLLCCDVWEHAYYLDYQSDRLAHVRAVMARLANWKFAASRLDALTNHPRQNGSAAKPAARDAAAA